MGTASGARVVTRWTITIRSFRAVPVPASAYPRDDDDASGTSSTANHASAAAANASSSSSSASPAAAANDGGPTPITKPRTMWHIWISDYPGLVFVLIEDSGKLSRAKVWREWEVRKKAWRKDRRQHLRQESTRRAQQAQHAHDDASAATGAAATHQGPSINDADSAAPADTQPQPQSASQSDPAAAQSTASAAAPTPDASSAPASQSQSVAVSITSPDQGQPVAAAAAATADDDVVMVDAASSAQGRAGLGSHTSSPKPPFRLPSHTRLTLSVLSASLPALLSKLNLPPPHGAPVGTAGPGAWVPRGAAVSIEGLVLDIGHMPAAAAGPIGGPADSSVMQSSNWRVRVGGVVGGGGRSAGAVIEAEFLPLESGTPGTGMLTDFLQALLPPNIGMLTTSTIGGTGQGGASMSTAGGGGVHARGGLAASGGMPGYGSRSAMGAGMAPLPFPGSNVGMMGGGGVNPARPSAASASQSGSVTVPVISDQLWEEVVPRSGAEWRRMIERRSLVDEAQRRQRKRDRAAAASAQRAEQGDSGLANDGASEIDMMDTDDENGAPPGSATVGVPAEDSDEDDDKPLGLLTAQAQQQQAAAAAAAAAVLPAKQDDGVRLHFQGLQAGSDSAAQSDKGWGGVERGRRMAFTYVQMLRAEGLI
ncbi:uncharacterized protein PSFLO_03947 [Pseudozyma flocculosa]|uniref:Uncharacterized protein n=1 Tax=Pseudozyma flocculosa TaxID=84751 RepID=A0A5C3F4X9_9BASI|nr:uncharacterized protein PSFLO_03947 [Pseudozyma flocculosa]